MILIKDKGLISLVYTIKNNSETTYSNFDLDTNKSTFTKNSF